MSSMCLLSHKRFKGAVGLTEEPASGRRLDRALTSLCERVARASHLVSSHAHTRPILSEVYTHPVLTNVSEFPMISLPGA